MAGVLLPYHFLDITSNWHKHFCVSLSSSLSSSSMECMCSSCVFVSLAHSLSLSLSPFRWLLIKLHWDWNHVTMSDDFPLKPLNGGRRRSRKMFFQHYLLSMVMKLLMCRMMICDNSNKLRSARTQFVFYFKYGNLYFNIVCAAVECVVCFMAIISVSEDV